MKRIAGLVIVFLWSLTTQASPDPINCTGYPEKRVFLEAQAAWYAIPGTHGESYGEMHEGTCFPQAQTVSGVVEFDLRVVVANFVGTFYGVNVGFETTSKATAAVSDSKTCSQQSCTFWYHLKIDTRLFAKDGRHELRFHAQAHTPDGDRIFASTGWQVYLKNGFTSSNYRSSDSVEARGWYTNLGYQNASISAYPFATVSGIWKPSVKMARGAGGSASSRHIASVDADYSMGNPGLIVIKGSGEYKGTLSIDTTRLSNGPHRLYLRTEYDEPVESSTLSGTQVIIFNVAN